MGQNCSHGVEADDCQPTRNYLDGEPTSLLKLMSLRLGDETPPNVQVLHGPPIGPTEEDVMGHDVVIAKGRHNRNDEIVGGRAGVSGLAKDVCKLGNHELVLA